LNSSYIHYIGEVIKWQKESNTTENVRIAIMILLHIDHMLYIAQALAEWNIGGKDIQQLQRGRESKY